MKITLDTKNKTISFEGNVLLEEMINTLENILPNGLWKEFTLITSKVFIEKKIFPKNPYKELPIIPYIPYEPQKPFDNQPWFEVFTTDRTVLKKGVFNISI